MKFKGLIKGVPSSLEGGVLLCKCVYVLFLFFFMGVKSKRVNNKAHAYLNRTSFLVLFWNHN